MQKYYLIYTYHDTYIREFINLTDLYSFLTRFILVNNFQNCKDFHYKVIHGKEVLIKKED